MIENKSFSTKSSDLKPEYQMTLQDYFVLVKIYYKLVLICGFIGLMIGFYKKLNSIPIYKATASVVLKESDASSLVMDFSGSNRQNKLINEMQLIKSRSLSKKVIESLWNSKKRNNLHIFDTKIFYFRGERVRRVLREVFTLGLYDPELNKKKQYNEPYTDAIGEKFSSSLINSLSVNNIRSTNILEISYTSINAEEATRITNLIAKNYVKLNAEQNKSDARYLVTFLDSLVLKKQKEIEIEDKKVRDFKLSNNMYSIDGDASGIVSQINSYESESYNISAEINIRKEKVDLLKSRLSKEEKTLTQKLRNNINDQLISIRLEISRLESQLIQNRLMYGNSHAAVLELNIKVNDLKKELDKKVLILLDKGISIQDPIQSRQLLISEIIELDSELTSLELRNIEIRKMLKLFNEKLMLLPEKQMELAAKIRDSNILNENYRFLREKYEEAKLNVAIQTGDALILDNARYPVNPINKNSNKNIFLFNILGFAFSFIIIFLLEIFDNSLKTIDEIEKYNLSILGIIPSIGNEKKTLLENNILRKIFNLKTQSNSNVKRTLMMKEDPKSPISEAYRGLRTSMLYSTDKKTKSIVVSSAGPGEGKTTTVANLAITYANFGKKTLLIDTDLRRPVIDKVFNVPREPGVTNFITNQTDDYKSLIKKTEIENLSIITSGLIPPNPSEMLGSSRMVQFIKKLEGEFEMILFDSPPLIAVTDANMISREIDQIVLVVKVGQTDKKAFHHTITNLENINAPLGGIIMNAVTNKTSYGSYYYYYQQYYHYYGNDKV